MPKNLKKIPKFKSLKEESEFWDTHDFVDYFDMETAIINPALPNLKPSSKAISLRLPETLLDKIKMEAHRRDMPYQSLMKTKLFEAFGF